MSDSDSPNFNQFQANGLVAPLIAGALTQNMLFGSFVVVFFDFARSSGWARASGQTKAVLLIVFALTTASTGFYMHDIFWYALTFTTDINILELGPSVEPYETVLVGTLAAIVQGVLALRASRLIRTPWIQWLYLVVIGAGSVLSLLSATGACVSWVYYTKTADFGFPLQYQQLFEAWMFSSALTDALISVSYIFLIHRNRKERSALGTSVVRVVTRYVLQSASYTTFFALVSAIVQASIEPNNPAQYDMSFLTWLPCSVLYAFSLFTTLSIPDRVQERLARFGPHVVADDELGSFVTEASFRRSSSPRRSALEGMITRPGEPAWEQRSTSFLGVRVALMPHEPALEKDERLASSRAPSSAPLDRG